MPATVTMKDLLEAGVHFGHQTSRWNPKMKPYIFGSRNGIYIIDLQKTVGLAKDALTFITQVAAQGKKVLFVGTKPQAQEVVRSEAERAGCPYVINRWLGGTLTNFQTIQSCLVSLDKIQQKKDTGLVDDMPKKERAAMEKEYERLMRNLGGVRDLKDPPGAIFVIDPSKEHIAVAEAECLKVPIVAITDTNCDPDPINYVIPGNDDAVKSIKLFATAVAEAYLDGKKIYEEKMRAVSDKKEDEPSEIEEIIAAEASTDLPQGAKSTTTDREGRKVAVEVKRSIKKETAE
ncbi:30S ribosomal protein S2 [bacterium]|nr:30S ribosomal protein S2 [bacterium]